MSVSHFKNCLFGLLLLFLAGACSESPRPLAPPPERPPASPKPETVETLATVRWTGTERIASDTNSAVVLEVARTPESVKLLKQTLDKLSQAPWLLGRGSSDTNASALLRPILDDALSHESRFEMALVGNQSIASALAVRIDSGKSIEWETHLSSIAESLLGKHPSPLPDQRPGWILHPAVSRNGSNQFPSIVFTRLDGWTVLGTAQDLAGFDSIVKRVLDQETSNSSPSNLWLEAMLDLPRLARRFSIPTNVFAPYPMMQLSLKGEDNKVRTKMTLSFAKPLDLNLAPWNVPTNLIEKPSASFSAIRGLDSLLSASKTWQSLKLSPAPDQLFVWAFDGQPRFTFFAAHDSDATGFVSRATELILPNGEGWLKEDTMAGFKKSAEHDGVEWQGLPYVWPFLRSVVTNGQGYVLGGTFAYTPVMEPLSATFYEKALQPKNLVYYGWEKTGQRIEHWLFIGQFIRFVSGKAQLPFESASVLWLKSLETKLGESVTRIHLTQPDQLQLTRSSSIGLTAIELHILTDWLESPEFPRGLHTLLAEPEKMAGGPQ